MLDILDSSKYLCSGGENHSTGNRSTDNAENRITAVKRGTRTDSTYLHLKNVTKTDPPSVCMYD